MSKLTFEEFQKCVIRLSYTMLTELADMRGIKRNFNEPLTKFTDAITQMIWNDKKLLAILMEEHKLIFSNYDGIAVSRIRWRDSRKDENKIILDDKLIFGYVNNLPLFYIHDNNHGGGTDRYQLEVKFLDERWSSNNLHELMDRAEQELEKLTTMLQTAA